METIFISESTSESDRASEPVVRAHYQSRSSTQKKALLAITISINFLLGVVTLNLGEIFGYMAFANYSSFS